MSDLLANPARGEFIISIGGKDRLLRFTFAELAKLDRVLGRSTVNILRDGEFGANTMMQALIVGLSASNPKITQRVVETWVCNDPSKISYYAEVLVQALAYAISGKLPEPPTLEDEIAAVDGEAADDAPDVDDDKKKPPAP